jgi:hypothetical protein
MIIFVPSERVPMKSLQEKYAPNSICFGCGPANHQGLKIQSLDSGNRHPDFNQPIVIAEFQPLSHHEAFPGMVNGGIIGALLDCHSNWTACYSLMRNWGDQEPPCTVTADFHVKLRAPTPSNQKVRLKAWSVDLGQTDLQGGIGKKPTRTKIEAQLFTLSPEGLEVLTATCVGTFVAVQPGHPAYHRWG